MEGQSCLGDFRYITCIISLSLVMGYLPGGKEGGYAGLVSCPEVPIMPAEPWLVPNSGELTTEGS